MYHWIDGSRADREHFLNWIDYMTFWYQARLNETAQPNSSANSPSKATAAWKTDQDTALDAAREKRPDDWRVKYKDHKLTDSWRNDQPDQ